MKRRFWIGPGLFLVAVWAIQSAFLLSKGGLFLGQHDADAMHLADISLRMVAGDWPHLDFMTPLGVLSAAPVALFIWLGQGVGHAILSAQVLMAAALLPAVWWVCLSRLPNALGAAFGGLVLILTLALVHGLSEPAISISMHYNRWGWALSFVVLAVAILPTVARRSSLCDGLVLGLGIAALVLIKATYVAAFLPPVVLALAMRRDWRTLGVATLSGLAVAVLITLFAGPAFWAAYLGDLLFVARSESRSAPGLPLNYIISAPAYLGATLTAFAGAMLLRKSGRPNEGLVLLLLLPGFIYVTYQNFGNDPMWLPFVAVLLLALRSASDGAHAPETMGQNALTLAAVVAAALAIPTLLNLGLSPARHFLKSEALVTPVFPRSERHNDMFVTRSRALNVAAKTPYAGYDAAKRAEALDRDPPEPSVLNGQTLPECTLVNGSTTMMDDMARDLEQAGYAGAQILAADLFSSFWLFGDFPRLPHGAPWYYGGLPGGDAVEYLLVPFCPVQQGLRAEILSQAAQAGWTLQEEKRTETYSLLAVQRP